MGTITVVLLHYLKKIQPCQYHAGIKYTVKVLYCYMNKKISYRGFKQCTFRLVIKSTCNDED